jgi:multisubunit Na+/H+ antiporter MnhF subunit
MIDLFSLHELKDLKKTTKKLYRLIRSNTWLLPIVVIDNVKCNLHIIFVVILMLFRKIIDYIDGLY